MSNQNNKQVNPGQFPVPRNSNQKQNAGLPGTSSRFGGSSKKSTGRFGGSSSSNRFGGSRFGGREEVQWTITPSKKVALRISLQGLGDPLHRLLGTPLNPELSDPAKVTEMLSKDEELQEKLAEALDKTWEAYNLRGAAMLYPWDEHIRKAFTDVIQPTLPPPPKKDDDSDDDEEYIYEDDDESPDLLPTFATKGKRVHSLRAIDAAFVMNILARSRANMLVSNTPLALEPGFLEKTVICDDPRIVKIAQATGCIDEDW